MGRLQVCIADAPAYSIEYRCRAALTPTQVHGMLEALSGRLQDQMALLQRLEAGVAAGPAPSSGGGGSGEAAEGLEARRDLLAQTVAKLQARGWLVCAPALQGGSGGA